MKSPGMELPATRPGEGAAAIQLAASRPSWAAARGSVTIPVRRRQSARVPHRRSGFHLPATAGCSRARPAEVRPVAAVGLRPRRCSAVRSNPPTIGTVGTQAVMDAKRIQSCRIARSGRVERNHDQRAAGGQALPGANSYATPLFSRQSVKSMRAAVGLWISTNSRSSSVSVGSICSAAGDGSVGW